MMIRFGIIMVALLVTNCRGESFPVDIEQGRLVGQDMRDRNGGIFYSFQSIPFAKPPVGELRFREPQEADPWNGELDATNDLPACRQNYYDGSRSGQEDCLYLNVYTKELQTDANNVSLDVMVWIYGGGFFQNAARQDLYSPEFLLTENIVLVTVNYRLGIFGSFHLSDTSLGYPGNLGLKDQSLALKWVQNNIAKFGGNPNSVTIFGESAGGFSVHLHVLSPLSAGTFNKAIIQSGHAMFMRGVPNNGILLAEALGIPTDNTADMITSLMSASVDEIFAGFEILAESIITISEPIIEEKVDGLNNFLTEEPISIIRSGESNDVALMVGHTDAEGIYFLSTYTGLVGVIPEEFNIEPGSDTENQLIAELENFYFGGNKDSENREAIIQIFTDTIMGYPTYRLAIEHQKTATNPIYYYQFSADTDLNVYKLSNPDFAGYPGASHQDELGYLFLTNYHDDITGVIEEDSAENIAIDRVVKLWTNFAIYGNPTPDDSTDFAWLPVTADTFNYVDIRTSETVPDVTPENVEFWDDIYDRYCSSGTSMNVAQSLCVSFNEDV